MSDISKLSNAELLAMLSDDELAQLDTEQNKPSGAIAAAGAGVADYSSFGFADEIEAGVKAAKKALTSEAKFKDAYSSELNKVRENYKKLSSENPVAYHGAGIASSLLAPGTSVAKGTLTVGKAIKGGAALGAVAGAGTSEASLLEGEVKDFIKDVGLSAIAGGAIGGVGQKITSTLAGKSDKLLNRAKELMTDSLKISPTKQEFLRDTLGKKWKTQIGGDLLEELATQKIRRTTSSTNLLDAVEAGTERYGKDIATLVNSVENKANEHLTKLFGTADEATIRNAISSTEGKIKQAMSKVPGSEKGMVTEEVADLLNQIDYAKASLPTTATEVANSLRARAKQLSAADPAKNEIEKLAATYAKSGETYGMSALVRQRRLNQEIAYSVKNPNEIASAASKRAREEARQVLNNLISNKMKLLDQEGEAAFKQLNKKDSALLRVKELVASKASKASNEGMSDMLAGASIATGGYILSSPLAGLATAAAVHAYRKKGKQIASKVAEVASKVQPSKKLPIASRWAGMIIPDDKRRQ